MHVGGLLLNLFLYLLHNALRGQLLLKRVDGIAHAGPGLFDIGTELSFLIYAGFSDVSRFERRCVRGLTSRAQKKRMLAGIVFGIGMAIGAVNFLAWLFALPKAR